MYFFKHDKCETEERVDEKTFKEFMKENWDSFCKMADEKKADGAVMIFKGGCPFCSLEGVEDAEVVLLRDPNKALPT
jgi:predicted secreted protein